MNGRRLESWVAALLRYGTWLASAAIAVGLVLGPMRIATMGIVLFILLPILRVSLMLLVFIRERDARLAVIAGMVLAIILGSVALAFRATSRIPG
jgi:uncharacterized membrane protein